VTLAPPPGFVPATGFAGFVRAELEASIGVTELPLPAAEVRARLPGGEALGPGASWHREAVATLGGEVVRYTAVLGDEQRAVVVVATVPLEHDEALAPAFRAAASSARWDPTRGEGAGELPFSFEEAPPLRVAARMGAVALLTVGGELRGGAEPMMTLGHAPVEPDRELGEVAEEHLRSVPQLNRIRVTGQDQRVQGAVVVHRLEAEARLSDGAVVAVVQWVVAGADDQVFALAVWPAGTDEAVRAAGAAVAASIRSG
jgi:hypothetical protein